MLVLWIFCDWFQSHKVSAEHWRDQSCHCFKLFFHRGWKDPILFFNFYTDALAMIESSISRIYPVEMLGQWGVILNVSIFEFTSLFLKRYWWLLQAILICLCFQVLLVHFFLLSEVVAMVAFCWHFQSPALSSHLTALVHPPSPPWCIIHNGITTPIYFWGGRCGWWYLLLLGTHWGQSTVWQLLK